MNIEIDATVNYKKSMTEYMKRFRENLVECTEIALRVCMEDAEARGLVPIDTGATVESAYTDRAGDTVYGGYNVPYIEYIYYSPEGYLKSGRRRWMEEYIEGTNPLMEETIREEMKKRGYNI